MAYVYLGILRRDESGSQLVSSTNGLEFDHPVTPFIDNLYTYFRVCHLPRGYRYCNVGCPVLALVETLATPHWLGGVFSLPPRAAYSTKGPPQPESHRARGLAKVPCTVRRLHLSFQPSPGHRLPVELPIGQRTTPWTPTTTVATTSIVSYC
ncbi:hypothetical protein LIA77_06685 [Sarocladium implicatum]|nr:hypothetical protein LIA77_06685 [Sarocladium implicatum]